jgi:putative transposase
MPLLRHFDHLNTARFVTFTCFRRLQLLTSDDVIQIVLELLDVTRLRHEFRLLGYVIMPEHVHLVLHPKPETKLGPVIGEFKSRSAARIIGSPLMTLPDVCRIVRHGTERKAFWQPRCYDHNCRTPETVMEKIHYCHNNPVKRRLVAEPREWKWSSYNWYCGERTVPISIDRFEGYETLVSQEPT